MHVDGEAHEGVLDVGEARDDEGLKLFTYVMLQSLERISRVIVASVLVEAVRKPRVIARMTALNEPEARTVGSDEYVILAAKAERCMALEDSAEII